MATGRRTSGTPGTGFIGLDSWARANSSGAQRLADELAQGVDSQGQAAQQGLTTLEQRGKDAIFNGTLFYEPGRDGYTYNSNDIDQISREGYRGPDSLREVEGYDAAMEGADRASQSARNVGDLYGRATALQDAYGKGRDYTSGQRLLDSALAGNAGGGRFQALNQQWGGLFNRAQGVEQAASASARNARATSEATQARYRSEIPAMRAEEGRQSNRDLADYMAGVEAVQDRNEERGGEAGAEVNPRRRGGNRSGEVAPKRSGGALSGWGSAGGWA